MNELWLQEAEMFIEFLVTEGHDFMYICEFAPEWLFR